MVTSNELLHIRNDLVFKADRLRLSNELVKRLEHLFEFWRLAGILMSLTDQPDNVPALIDDMCGLCLVTLTFRIVLLLKKNALNH